MATKTLTSNDVRTRDAVTRQLDWDPGVDNSAIGVTVENGVVTLTGFVDTYAGKLTAERIAKRVCGVRAVANDIAVRLKLERTDTDLARDAARALELRAGVPESVQATVHNGHVTLTGRVAWIAQKRHAEKAISHVRGVRGVFNHIDVIPDRTQKDVRRRITEALHRTADLEGRQIAVSVSGDVVVLTGSVGSWFQRETAEHAAASAPGIRWVDNRLIVHPPEAEETRWTCCAKACRKKGRNKHRVIVACALLIARQRHGDD
jgi:osmotically-inducible protein OsmY